MVHHLLQNTISKTILKSIAEGVSKRIGPVHTGLISSTRIKNNNVPGRHLCRTTRKRKERKGIMICVLRIVPSDGKVQEHYEITRWEPKDVESSAFAKGNIETVAASSAALLRYVSEFGRGLPVHFAPNAV